MSDHRHELYRHYERLGIALIRCMEQLKSNRQDGFGTYYHAVDEIDGLMQTCAYSENSEAAIEGPLSRMHEAADHEDTAALSSVLESQVYPIVKAWLQATQETE